MLVQLAYVLVAELSLENNQIYGTIPEELGYSKLGED